MSVSGSKRLTRTYSADMVVYVRIREKMGRFAQCGPTEAILEVAREALECSPELLGRPVRAWGVYSGRIPTT